MKQDSFSLDLDVHGGITYGGYSKKYPIESDMERFWLGFDCAHYMDGRDFNLIKELSSKEQYEYSLDMEKRFPLGDEIARTTEYVEEQIMLLVNQLTKEES